MQVAVEGLALMAGQYKEYLCGGYEEQFFLIMGFDGPHGGEPHMFQQHSEETSLHAVYTALHRCCSLFANKPCQEGEQPNCILLGPSSLQPLKQYSPHLQDSARISRFFRFHHLRSHCPSFQIPIAEDGRLTGGEASECLTLAD